MIRKSIHLPAQIHKQGFVSSKLKGKKNPTTSVKPLACHYRTSTQSSLWWTWMRGNMAPICPGSCPWTTNLNVQHNFMLEPWHDNQLIKFLKPYTRRCIESQFVILLYCCMEVIHLQPLVVIFPYRQMVYPPPALVIMQLKCIHFCQDKFHE